MFLGTTQLVWSVLVLAPTVVPDRLVLRWCNQIKPHRCEPIRVLGHVGLLDRARVELAPAGEGANERDAPSTFTAVLRYTTGPKIPWSGLALIIISESE